MTGQITGLTLIKILQEMNDLPDPPLPADLDAVNPADDMDVPTEDEMRANPGKVFKAEGSDVWFDEDDWCFMVKSGGGRFEQRYDTYGTYDDLIAGL